MSKATLSSSMTTLSSRGQVVIPADVREKLGLKTGLNIDVIARDDGVIELRPRKRKIADFFKMFEPDSTQNRMSDDEAIMQAVLESDNASRGIVNK